MKPRLTQNQAGLLRLLLFYAEQCGNEFPRGEVTDRWLTTRRLYFPGVTLSTAIDYGFGEGYVRTINSLVGRGLVVNTSSVGMTGLTLEGISVARRLTK